MRQLYKKTQTRRNGSLRAEHISKEMTPPKDIIYKGFGSSMIRRINPFIRVSVEGSERDESKTILNGEIGGFER
jgi:hypothetical protein